MYHGEVGVTLLPGSGFLSSTSWATRILGEPPIFKKKHKGATFFWKILKRNSGGGGERDK
jgi:hypothetical protein